MNYSEMSGYEINNRVHNIEVCGGKYDLSVEGYRVTWKNRETGEETVTLRKQYDKHFKDYIGSWIDAGSIIEKHGISLAFDGNEWMAAANACWVDGAEWNLDGVFHSNPLRAAMIVYLMMHDKGEE